MTAIQVEEPVSALSERCMKHRQRSRSHGLQCPIAFLLWPELPDITSNNSNVDEDTDNLPEEVIEFCEACNKPYNLDQLLDDGIEIDIPSFSEGSEHTCEYNCGRVEDCGLEKCYGHFKKVHFSPSTEFKKKASVKLRDKLAQNGTSSDHILTDEQMTDPNKQDSTAVGSEHIVLPPSGSEDRNKKEREGVVRYEIDPRESDAEGQHTVREVNHLNNGEVGKEEEKEEKGLARKSHENTHLSEEEDDNDSDDEESRKRKKKCWPVGKKRSSPASMKKSNDNLKK